MTSFLRTTALACSLALLLCPQVSFAEDSVTADPAPVADENADAGSYLAARVSGTDGNFAEAAKWYTQSLLADPMNADLQDGALLTNLAAGRMDQAVTIARELGDGAKAHQSALIALLADQAKRGDFDSIIRTSKAGTDLPKALDVLTLGWAQLGAGRMSDAEATFDTLNDPGAAEVFGAFHKALALASVGNFDAAEAILSGPLGGNIEGLRRAVVAHAQILSQLERNPDAIALLDRVFIRGQDPQVEALRARLAAGEPVPFDIVTTPQDGIAEVFFTLATALQGDVDDVNVLVHGRVAAWLRPDHAEALLLVANIFNKIGQPQLAIDTYAAIAPDDPQFHIAEMGRARALLALDKPDAAIEVMTALARSHPKIVGVQQELGRILLKQEKYDAAITAFDAAIALIGDDLDENDFNLFFSRGIAQERQKRWPQAEADFLKALELKPNEPAVLNYMGYSYLEMGQNMDKALDMIQRAVKAEPDSGYIIDSLAWAYYRMGRYQEALEPMEKASLLEPVDPVVTDHLGDVYWAVGRKLEAQFQWQRALSFEPEEKDADRIRRKLEVGLDKVLAEEGAKPIGAVTAADGN